MACWSERPSDAGYATPAALVLSLALGLIASALLARNIQMLQLAHADLARSREAAILEGAQFEAAAEIIRSGVAGPYRWLVNTDDGPMEAVAEPESDKLDIPSGAALSDEVLAAFGVSDMSALRSRLTADEQGATPIGNLDPAPAWRACAPSLVSPLGRKQQFVYLPRQKPGPSLNPASWHIGEAWRVRIATSAGWGDDRIVRFTGDARRPTAIVLRSFGRAGSVGSVCDDLLGPRFSGG